MPAHYTSPNTIGQWPYTLQFQTTETVRIVGPKTARAGQLMVFEAEGEADSYTWLILPHTPHYRVFNEGRTLVLSSRGGTYTLILGAAIGGKVTLVQHTVIVEAPDPGGLNIVDWCQEYGLPKDEALELSKSFASVASIIESGAIKTVEDVIKATQKANHNALGEDKLQQWEPMFLRLASYLDRNTPETVAAHAAVWRKIAAQLETYGARA